MVYTDLTHANSPILPQLPLITPQAKNPQTNHQVTSQQAADDNLQSVFTEILKQAGRDGFASADPPGKSEAQTAQPLNLGQSAQQTWNEWFQSAASTRYAANSFAKPQDPVAIKQGYAEILGRAYDAGAYSDPKTFLKSLSKAALEVVQHVQRLAQPIQVDSLSEEGALNLLIPPPAQVDLNWDGFTQNGAAFGIRFPDSRTPKPVAEAWEQATADLPPGEKMMYELQMKLPLLTANTVIGGGSNGGSGQVVRVREPGDADFVNPLSDPNYSYVGAAQNMLDYLDAFKFQMSQQQYETQHDFWSNFQQALSDRGAT